VPLKPLSVSASHLLIWVSHFFFFFRKGFEDDRIEALLHKIEIQTKHQSASFGLTLTSVRDLLTTTAFPSVLCIVPSFFLFSSF
jgi:hypothetical protein